MSKHNIRELMLYLYKVGRNRHRTPKYLHEYWGLLFANYGLGKKYEQEISDNYWQLVREGLIESDENEIDGPHDKVNP